MIETANTGFAAQDRSGAVSGREMEDGVRLRIRVLSLSRGGGRTRSADEVECYAGGVVFARGDTEAGLYNASRAENLSGEHTALRVLLAGQGGARGSGGVLLKTASAIGIRAPMWDVNVGEERWTVAVDWVLL